MNENSATNFEHLISALPHLEAKLLGVKHPEYRPFLDINGIYWFPGDLRLIPRMALGLTQTVHRKERVVKIIQHSLGQSKECRKLNTQADLIRIGAKSNKGIRIFYAKSTLKIRLSVEDSESDSPWYSREVQGREALQAAFGGRIGAPKVMAAGEENGVSYLLEERLKCRAVNPNHAQDRQKMKHELLPLLMDWYQLISEESMASLFGEEPEAIVRKALTSSVMAEMKPKTVQVFHDIAERINNYDIKIPLTMAHGDMCTSNVCITPKGKIVLVDWEKWGKHPVLTELVRITRDFGIGSDIHNLIRQVYNRRFIDSRSSFDFQLLVYLFLKSSRKLIGISNLENIEARQRSLAYLDNSKDLKVCTELVRELNESQEQLDNTW